MRLPPVTVQASGIPVASTKRWCLEPFLALSTGLGPVAAPPFALARGWSRRPRATTRSRRPRATSPTAARAAAPTRPPAATHRAADSTSPSRSRARAAGAATRSLCARRTRSPAAPPGQANAYGPDSGNAAPPSAKAARAAPTARPKRSTAHSHRHPSQLGDGCRRRSSPGSGSLHSDSSSKRPPTHRRTRFHPRSLPDHLDIRHRRTDRAHGPRTRPLCKSDLAP